MKLSTVHSSSFSFKVIDTMSNLSMVKVCHKTTYTTAFNELFKLIMN